MVYSTGDYMHGGWKIRWQLPGMHAMCCAGYSSWPVLIFFALRQSQGGPSSAFQIFIDGSASLRRHRGHRVVIESLLLILAFCWEDAGGLKKVDVCSTLELQKVEQFYNWVTQSCTWKGQIQSKIVAIGKKQLMFTFIIARRGACSLFHGLYNDLTFCLQKI